MMLTKRLAADYRSLLATVVALVLATSCRGSDQSSQIVTIIGENTSTIQAMMSLEQEYESQHPGVDIQFKPNTFDDAFNKANQDFQNHTALYDIVMQYNLSLSSFVTNRYVHNLSDLLALVPDANLGFEADIFENTWKTVGFYYADPASPGPTLKKVGYPFVANSFLLMYNREMFADKRNQTAYRKRFGTDLEPPKTWEAFARVAEFFTDAKRGYYGVCIEGASGSFLYFEFANYLHGMGGAVLQKTYGWQGDVSTPVVLDNDAGVAAFSFFRNLKPLNAGNFFDVEQFKQMEIMKQGKTAMALAWEDVISLNLQTDPTFSERFGFTVIPGDRSVVGGGAFFVNRDSKHPAEAFRFILYVMQPDVQRRLALKGLSSPLRSIYNDPDVKRISHMPALQKSLERGGIYLEAGPDSNMISDTLSNYLQRMWRDEINPGVAARDAAAEIRRRRPDSFKVAR